MLTAAATAVAAAEGPLDPVTEIVCGLTEPQPLICPASGRVWNVPGHAATIQGGIDLAEDGDTVLVAPGVYRENPTISGKTITLASHYQTTGDPDTIAATIIDGSDRAAALTVAADAGPATAVIGFTIRNADDGIKARGSFTLLNNRIIDTSDGIDVADAAAMVIRDNVFEANSDDGVDFDGASGGVVERNRIVGNDDDGIEIRLHPYTGNTLEIEIRNNVIDGNGEDGIQLIDYDGLSDRVFRIHANLITRSAQVGLGMMAGGNTREDFSGAGIPEPIELYNNTFWDNPAAVTGGHNVTARNNIFAGSSIVGIKNVDGASTVRYSLFWSNAQHYQSSNVDAATTLYADPMFDASYRLRPGSPAIDAGTNVGLPYHGRAPDLGAYESGLA